MSRSRRPARPDWSRRAVQIALAAVHLVEAEHAAAERGLTLEVWIEQAVELQLVERRRQRREARSPHVL